MFASKTVFVVGAGASNDLGLPLGPDLRNRLVGVLHDVKVQNSTLMGPEEITRAMHKRANEAADPRAEMLELVRAAATIAKNLRLVRSIDEFVDHNSGDSHIEFIAKCAICYEIISAEHRSLLLAKAGH